MEREEGYYWVRFPRFRGESGHFDWEVRQWRRGQWWLAGSEEAEADSDAVIVGPRMPSPEVVADSFLSTPSP